MSRLIHPSRWVQGTVLLVIFLCGWTLVKFALPTGEVLGKSLDTYLLQLGAPMPKDRESAREVIEQHRERFPHPLSSARLRATFRSGPMDCTHESKGRYQ